MGPTVFVLIALVGVVQGKINCGDTGSKCYSNIQCCSRSCDPLQKQCKNKPEKEAQTELEQKNKVSLTDLKDFGFASRVKVQPIGEANANAEDKTQTNAEPITEVLELDLGQSVTKEELITSSTPGRMGQSDIHDFPPERPEEQTLERKQCKKKSCKKNKRKELSLNDNKKIQISQVGNVSIMNSNVNSYTGGSKITNIGNTQSQNLKHIHNFNFNKHDSVNYNMHNHTGGLKHMNMPTFNMKTNFLDNSKYRYVHGACGGHPCHGPVPSN